MTRKRDLTAAVHGFDARDLETFLSLGEETRYEQKYLLGFEGLDLKVN